MRIDRLAVTDLRRHRVAEVELAPGLTIIRGPNEAGKSTLARAIEIALARPVAGDTGDTTLAPWDAPDATTSIAMAFTWEDEDGAEHHGIAAKQFGPRGAAVRLELDDAPIPDPVAADAALAEITGMPSEAFLRATASVHHHELSGIARDETSLRERLAASLSGADRSTLRARRRLERALDGLRGRGERNPGRLKVAEEAVADAAARVQAGEDALARLLKDREAHTVALQRRAEAEATLADRRALLEKARLAERLNADREAAERRFDTYQSAVALRAELAELDGTHPSSMSLPALRVAVDAIRTTDAKIATLEGLLADEVHVEFAVPPEVPWRSRSRLAALLVILGVALAAGGFAADQAGVPGLWPAVPAAAAVIAGIGLILSIQGLLRSRANRIEQTMRDAEVSRRLRGRSEIEEELRQRQAERATGLESVGVETTEAAEERLAAESAHVAGIDERRARLRGLVGDEPLDGLDLRRDTARHDVDRSRAALAELGPIAREPNARARLEGEVRESEAATERARDDESTARARAEQNPADADEVAGLAERLASWRSELASLRRRDRIYARTLEEIDVAEAATREKATRFLERAMSQDIAAITGGRYTQVRVRDADMGIEVMAPENDAWVPVEILSQGTLDTVYLAARLALVRHLTGDRRPPILLDDPFVTMDEDRATRALGLLRRLTADFQVVYFTTSDRYDRDADRVVVLQGPAATGA